MITRPEEVATDADLAEFERYLDFTSARRRLQATLANLPLVEAPGNRTWAYRVRFRFWEPMPTVPFGWAAERRWDRNAWEVGPAWFILPRRWFRQLSDWFYGAAVRVGLAECPYEGCRYDELRWFPNAPRFE